MNTRSKRNGYLLVALLSGLLLPPLIRAAVPDGDINDNVKDALRTDPRLNGSELSATTASGIVTLSGIVDNRRQRL